MTVRANQSATGSGRAAPAQRTPLTIAADGSYAARLVTDGAQSDRWYPERWTLDGPEPYTVPLPGGQPEEPSSEVVPLSDGRVLISRRAGDHSHVALLYPLGPDTGELPLGTVECQSLSLLPPAPDGTRVYGLVPEDGVTALWLVCGGAFGPELVARVPGWCAGGAWLDQRGRLLALDRTDTAGRTRAVTVDVENGGELSELLRIAEDSNDRLLLADPDSGLLLVRSDAPGAERVGWAVLGSHRPVRFPEALHQEGVRITPFAVQPGQMLEPESCAVALRMAAATGEWLAVWRPQEREVRQVTAPDGWLPGAGLWTTDGELLLPYAAEDTPCGLARVSVPGGEPRAATQLPPTEQVPEVFSEPEPEPEPGPERSSEPEPARETASPDPSRPASSDDPTATAAPATVSPRPAPSPTEGVAKPVPLQQAPLARLN